MMYDEELPDFEVFSSEEVRYYFKLWELLKYVRENPIYTKSLEADQYGVENEVYTTNLENGISASLLASRRGLNIEEKDLLFSENEIVNQYFTSVLDQPTFISQDHARLRGYLKDWYTSNRALVTKSRNAVNPYYMTSPELDELILSFGFPYPYELNRGEKAEFLHHLIEYYKHKGSPQVLGTVMGFYGRVGLVLSEWWVKHVPSATGQGIGNFIMESSPIWPTTIENKSELIITIPYEQFVASDPLWHYDKPTSSEKLRDLYWEIDGTTGERKNKITLPSITPYISLNNVVDHKKFTSALSILNRKIQEAYEYWVEYELNYLGAFNRYPISPSPSRQDVIRHTGTNTHHVYNGIKWIDLRMLLPEELVTASPSCPLKPSQYAPRDVLLNIASEINATNFPEAKNKIDYGSSFTFFEAVLGMFYLLGVDYLVALKRLDNNYNGSNITQSDLENDTYWQALAYDRYIVYVEETDSDWVTYTVFDKSTNTYEHKWVNLNYTVDYTSTTGEISAILFIPPVNSGHYIQRFLQYGGDYDDSTGVEEWPGAHAPLDTTYIDELGDVQDGCRDAIDDEDYDLIVDEYNDIMEKPKITIDNSLESWSKVEHRFRDAYYSLLNQKKDKLTLLNSKFYRNRYTDEAQQDSSFLYLSNVFLEAANPILYYAIYNKLYIVATTFPLDLLRVNKIRESYINDLTLYLVDIGLTPLRSLTSLIIGHSLHSNLIDIINFFKPFRARFRSFLTEYQIDDPVSDGAYADDDFFLSRLRQIINEHPNVDEQLTFSTHMYFEEGDTDIFDGWSRNLFDIFKITQHLIFKEYPRDIVSEELGYSESYHFKDHVDPRDDYILTVDHSINEPDSPVYDAFEVQDEGGIGVYDAESGDPIAFPDFGKRTEYGPNILTDTYNSDYNPYDQSIYHGWLELDNTYTPLSILTQLLSEELYTDKGWTVVDGNDETSGDPEYQLYSNEFNLTEGFYYRVVIDIKYLNDPDIDFTFDIVDSATSEVYQTVVPELPENWNNGQWHRINTDVFVTYTETVKLRFNLGENGVLIPVDLVSVKQIYELDPTEVPQRYWNYILPSKQLTCGDLEEPIENPIQNYYTFHFSDYISSTFSDPITKGKWELSGNIDYVDGTIYFIFSSTSDPDGAIYTKTCTSSDATIEWMVEATELAPINTLIIYIDSGEGCVISDFKLRQYFENIID